MNPMEGLSLGVQWSPGERKIRAYIKQYQTACEVRGIVPVTDMSQRNGEKIALSCRPKGDPQHTTKFAVDNVDVADILDGTATEPWEYAEDHKERLGV